MRLWDKRRQESKRGKENRNTAGSKGKKGNVREGEERGKTGESVRYITSKRTKKRYIKGESEGT